MQPVRVAALMDTAVVSGPGRQLVAAARELRQLEVETRLIMFHRRGTPMSALPAYARGCGISCDVVEESGRLDVRVLFQVSRLARAYGAHILQSHSYKPAAVAAVLRRRLGIPWIGMFHGITLEDRRVRFYNWLDHQLLRRADRIVVVSPSQRELFPEVAQRLTIIPNAVLPGGPEADAAPLPIDERLPRPRIAVIGRLSHEKGVDVFLNAWAVVRARGITGTALVIGDGPDRGLLETQAAALGLSGNTVFLGHLTSIDAFYRHVDLVVIPSRSEGMPNVLLEAIRADVPVVATAVGAIPTVVGDRSGVLVVPAEDPALLADAIMRGLSDLRTEDARRGREAIAEEYSLERRARLLRELYDGVMASAESPRRAERAG